MVMLDEDDSRLVVGDDYDVIRTITNIPSGALLETGWLTIRESPSGTIVIEKEINSVAVPGVGQITDVGDSVGEGAIIFQLTSAETVLLDPHKLYSYDIQVQTDTGKIFTREIGGLVPLGQITL